VDTSVKALPARASGRYRQEMEICKMVAQPARLGVGYSPTSTKTVRAWI